MRTRLHVGLFVALGCAVVLSVLLRYTVFGFRLRATGENPVAARWEVWTVFGRVRTLLSGRGDYVWTHWLR